MIERDGQDGQKRELNQMTRVRKAERRGQEERMRAEALCPLKFHSIYKGPIVHSFHQYVLGVYYCALP